MDNKDYLISNFEELTWGLWRKGSHECIWQSHFDWMFCGIDSLQWHWNLKNDQLDVNFLPPQKLATVMKLEPFTDIFVVENNGSISMKSCLESEGSFIFTIL